VEHQFGCICFVEQEADCQSWAAEGQCEMNPLSMNTLCPQSCGLCQGLEMFYRSAFGTTKDEL
jgi:hypothetical protein